MPSSKRSRDFLLRQGQPASNHVLLFSDLLAQRKSLSDETTVGNSLSCNLLSQLIDNSATKGRFCWRQKTELLFSLISRYSSVLAANDCRFQVKSFLQRSTSFCVGSRGAVVSAALSERKVAGSIPTIGDFHTVGPCKKAVFACLATDVK